jgi:predicted ATPase
MEDALAPERSPAAPTFVGRARELAELRRGVDEAIRGQGRLFLLAGEPGIGKTRLADELAREAAARGVQVVWGRCWEGDGAPPYWPIIQALRGCVEARDAGQLEVLLGPGTKEISQLIPEFRAARPTSEETRIASDQEAARFRLFAAVSAFLKNVARSAPLLIIVDDLHDADQPSLQMLRFIAREIKGVRIALIGTYRDAEVRQSPELGRLVGDLIREGLTIPLTGLSQSEIGQFIEHSVGQKAKDALVAELYKATSGSPLFVEGVVRLLIAEGKIESNAASFEIPDGVRESIRRRLTALSTEAIALLSMASVIGNDFDIKLLISMSGYTSEQVTELMEEAARLGIVAEGVAPHWQFRFSHALVREVLYKDLPAIRRIALHNEIGVAIEKFHQADLTPYQASLAYHFIAAGVTAKAIECSLAAGAASSEVFAYQEARAHWQRALDLMQGEFGSPAHRASLARRLGALCFMIDYAAAIRYEEAALAIYQSLGDEERVAECHTTLGVYCAVPDVDTTDIARARAHFSKAKEILTRRPEGSSLARVYTGITQIAFISRRTEEGLAAGKLGMEIAERLHDDARWAGTAIQYAIHLLEAGRVAESRAVQEETWQKSDRVNIGDLALISAWSGGTCRAFLLDIPDALRWYDRELNKPRNTQYRSALIALYADALARRGDLARAKALAPETTPTQYRADILFCEGRWDEAQALVRQKMPKFQSAGDLTSLASCYGVLIDICRVNRRYEEALETIAALFATAHDELQLPQEMAVRPISAAIHLELGDLDSAERELARCREIMKAGEDWRGLEGVVIRAEAALAAAEGRLKEAETKFEKAIEIFRRFEVPFEQAETLLLWGKALSAAGENVRGGEKLDHAIAIYRRCGAGDRWINRVEAAKAAASSPLVSATRRISRTALAEDDAEFRREGDYWTVSHEGKTSRFKDAKGFHYIARLLAHPGEDLRALDLVTLVSGDSVDRAESGESRDRGRSHTVAADLGDAGEVLDAQAKSAYRARLAQLEEELADARELGNEARIEKAEQEIEALSRELKRAVGLSGRGRRAASSQERARIAVTQAIRFALGKIAKNDATLSKMLTSTIKTGSVCSYRPPDRSPIRWRL